MKYPVYLLLGYTEIRFPVSDLRSFLNLANRYNICALKLTVRSDHAVVRILTKERERVLACMKNACICPESVKNCGVPPFFARYKHRAGLIAGLILFFTAIYVSPLFLWEIRITGLDRLSREDVAELLREEGVYIGAFSPTIDRRKVYTDILQKSDEISWLTVNIRGSSANVEIVERDYFEGTGALLGGANLVAAKDGVVADADVIRGKVIAGGGTVVRKGDLLVSGVIDTERAGTRYVRAEGAVYAEVSDTFTVEVPFSDVRKVYGEEKSASVSLSFFGKSINIFKNSSIYAGKYDTISREESLPFLRLDTLPFSVTVECVLPYTEETVVLTEEEARKVADAKLKRIFSEKTTYAELLSADTSYTVTDFALILTCNVEAIENIAAVVEFSVQ